MAGNPPTLIDKSFLQSITLDEAFWFFTFFDGVLTPVLVAEIIGDLTKQHRDGRDPGTMVSSLARKLYRTPAKLLNVSHAELGSHELLGQQVEMKMRPVVYGARFRNEVGGILEVADNFGFLEMLEAWDEGNYSSDEFRRSAIWREYAKRYDPASVIEATASIPRPPELDNLDLGRVRALQVDSLLDQSKGRENLDWAFAEFKTPKKGKRSILKRWDSVGRPSLYDFAPYTAFTLLVIRTHMFASGLELTGGKQKPSDVIDMEYLFYVPFCRFFVTNDRFQMRFFENLGERGQLGVSGESLKSSLKEIVEFYGGSPLSNPLHLSRRELSAPPRHMQNDVTRLWDFSRRGWR